MAKAYKDYKVSELKAFLQERELSQTGTKPELIARLEEDDSKKTESKDGAPGADPVADNEAAKAEPEAKGEPKLESAPKVAAKPEEKSEAQPEEAKAAPPEAAPEVVPAEPELSPEELAAQQIKELETRIERMKRFGEDTADLEAQVKRIQRFGYTAPIKVDAPRPFRNKRHFKKRQPKVTK